MCKLTFLNFPETLKYWVGVQWGQSYLRGERASLALVGHPSSDVATIKNALWGRSFTLTSFGDDDDDDDD